MINCYQLTFVLQHALGVPVTAINQTDCFTAKFTRNDFCYNAREMYDLKECTSAIFFRAHHVCYNGNIFIRV